jgi:hypothetical protein
MAAYGNKVFVFAQIRLEIYYRVVMQTFTGGFLLEYFIQYRFIGCPSDFTVSEDAKSDPGLKRLFHWQSDAVKTRLDLIEFHPCPF